MAKSKSPRKNTASSPPSSATTNGHTRNSPSGRLGAAAAALHNAVMDTSPPQSQQRHSPTLSPKNAAGTPSKSKALADVKDLPDTPLEGRAEAGGRPNGILSPSTLSYLGSNLLDSLRPDRKNKSPNGGNDDDKNKDNGNESDSSESSEDSEMDYSSSSSESSISSSHSTEDEEEEDEDLEEEEDDEEEEKRMAEEAEDRKRIEENNSSMSNGYSKAVRKKSKQQRQRQRKQQQLAAAGSPLLVKTLQHEQLKHMQQVMLQQQQPPSPKSPNSPEKHSRHEHGKPASTESVVLLADQTAKAKWANWSVRTLWTLIMIGGFFACVAAGPLFVILLVVMVQGLVYKEVIYLAAVPSREKKLPWFRAMNWYFLFSTNYFFYGESFIHNFQHVVFKDAFLLPLATHHRFISFTLYVIGFVFFVANLKKGHYRFQFSQFAWTHMTLLLVVCQSHFIINNIFEGLIWFFLPVSLVIANDIWAYIFGFFWGKTPLIKLSPKKTVEGFVGGWIMTIVFGMLFATLFLRYPYMICPVKDLRSTAFSGLTCDPNPVFVPVKYYLKPWMVALVRHLGMRNHYVMIAPLQLHAIFMACFASLIAPFGGFFASGFKRAFKIKDFGHSIPGHGGITDRMDCQFLMGLFSYMYYQSFIKTSALSVGVVLQSAINNLQGQEQMELFDHMRQYLIGQGMLDEESCVIMPPKEPWVSS